MFFLFFLWSGSQGCFFPSDSHWLEDVGRLFFCDQWDGVLFQTVILSLKYLLLPIPACWKINSELMVVPPSTTLTLLSLGVGVSLLVNQHGNDQVTYNHPVSMRTISCQMGSILYILYCYFYLYI